MTCPDKNRKLYEVRPTNLIDKSEIRLQWPSRVKSWLWSLTVIARPIRLAFQTAFSFLLAALSNCPNHKRQPWIWTGAHFCTLVRALFYCKHRFVYAFKNILVNSSITQNLHRKLKWHDGHALKNQISVMEWKLTLCKKNKELKRFIKKTHLSELWEEYRGRGVT